MIKLYFRLLTIFIVYLLLINLLTFFAGCNYRQLVNPLYLKSRTVSATLLIKNIILETGINVKDTTIPERDIIVSEGAEKYGIDADIINSVLTGGDFSITTFGGMGLSNITYDLFFTTEYSDPFKTRDNIFAAAVILKNLYDNGTPEDELKKAYLSLLETSNVR